MWLEIDLTRDGAGIRAGARGQRGEQTAPHLLDLDGDAIERFAAAVRGAAACGRALSAEALDQARALHRAVLGTDIDPLRARLAEAAGGPLLLRLALYDPALKAVPWEALCKPGEALGFWGSSPDLLTVRGVVTDAPWQPRAVRGALRVLAVAPAGGAGLDGLKDALAARIEPGEIEWLDPVVGPAAGARPLFDRLRREPTPHVLHFLGHGGQRDGVAVLRLADDEDGDETWLPVELLAQHIKASLRGFLRLVVLEACEGARPSVFASAAEILVRAGVDATVAHLWPVKADVARTCSAELYRVLAGADQDRGDVALALNAARRAILATFDGSAEAFSPVAYLRGPDGVLFDFEGRKVAPLSPAASAKKAPSGVDPALARLLGQPFSLLLGDRFTNQLPELQGLRERLHRELVKLKAFTAPDTGALSFTAIAQRYALHRGPAKLYTEFQKAFRAVMDLPPFIRRLARHLGPGVHTNLLRFPALELLVAEAQPDRTLYVIQPAEDGVVVLCRAAGGDWEEIDEPPDTLDADKEILFLRLYGGYTPELILSKPLLTEDDYAVGLGDLEASLPPDLANIVLSTLSYRPALILALSMYAGQHRAVLRRVYPRGVPRGSLALLDPEDIERAIWEKGTGLPGMDEGVAVVEMTLDDLAAALDGTGEEAL